MGRRKSKDAYEWRNCAYCKQLFKIRKCQINYYEKRGTNINDICCSKHCMMLLRHKNHRSTKPISNEEFLGNYKKYMVAIHYAMGKQPASTYIFATAKEIKNYCISWLYEKWNDIMAIPPEKRISYIITLCDRKIQQYIRVNNCALIESLQDLQKIGIQPFSRKDRPDTKVFAMYELQDAYNKIKATAGKGVAWKVFYDYIDGATFDELEKKYGYNPHDAANKIAYCRFRISKSQ